MKQWQDENYFGRHVSLVPAEFGKGYQYRPILPYEPYPDRNMVIRAVPAEGTVADPDVYDRFGPQVLMRMGIRKKRSATERIAAFMKRIRSRR